MWDQGLTQLYNGLIAGSAYALVALGLTLVYGVLGVVNFAHGELYMLGAYLVFFLVVTAKVNFFLAVPLVFVAGLIFGPLINEVVFEPLRGQHKINTLISSLGLSIVLSNVALVCFGPAPLFLNTPFSEKVFTGFGVTISAERLLALTLAALTLIATWFLLRRTRIGKAVRAVAENESVSSLMGINPKRIKAVTFAYATGLAAMAGAIFAPLFVINPFVGSLTGLKAFAVVIVGGFGNVQGTILAALLLGVVEALATGFIPSTYKDTIAFAILLIALLIRPQGIIKELLAETA
jgi:branched-chain amino acid transport system permease protein